MTNMNRTTEAEKRKTEQDQDANFLCIRLKIGWFPNEKICKSGREYKLIFFIYKKYLEDNKVCMWDLNRHFLKEDT